MREASTSAGTRTCPQALLRLDFIVVASHGLPSSRFHRCICGSRSCRSDRSSTFGLWTTVASRGPLARRVQTYISRQHGPRQISHMLDPIDIGQRGGNKNAVGFCIRHVAPSTRVTLSFKWNWCHSISDRGLNAPNRLPNCLLKAPNQLWREICIECLRAKLLANIWTQDKTEA